MRLAPLAPLALVLALAPLGARAQDGPPPPPEPMLETPYTAAQIASACPVGRKMKFALEAEGQTQYQVLEFKAVTAEGATLLATLMDKDGKPTGEQEETKATWEELRDHAQFPSKTSSRAEGSLTTPAGTFACWVYTVREDEEGLGTTTFWFAKDLAGPPVKIEAREGDAKSPVVYSMTLVEHSPGK